MGSILFSRAKPWITRAKCVEAPEWPDEVEFARTRLGFFPDEKQCEILLSKMLRGILNCTRQWGKTEAIAAKVIYHVVSQGDRLVIVASPGERQSAAFNMRLKRMLRKLKIKITKYDGVKFSIVLPNGSTILGLPEAPGKVRGYGGVTMVVIEEAAYVSDEMYAAVSPMLATTNGPLWMLSTSNTKSGFFYETWQHGGPEWHRVRVIATECPRISKEFLERERAALGIVPFRREFLCEFTGDGVHAFDRQVVEDALDNAIEPMPLLGAEAKALAATALPAWLTARPNEAFVVGVDLGKKHDHSTIAVVEKCGDELLVRGVERIALGTPYMNVVEMVREVVRSPRLVGRCALIVDATAVGEPVVEMMRRADLGCGMTAAVITGGSGSRRSGGYQHLSKSDLMTGLQLSLEKSELKIAKRMKEAGSLVKELTDIRIKTNGAMGAEGAGEHDDMVIAVALACWKARRGWNDRGSGGFL